MGCMFKGCLKFNKDISSWDISKVSVKNMEDMFKDCPIKQNYKPKVF